MLIRVVSNGDGGVAVGRTLPGRGAWLCADSPACVDVAGRRDSLGRALRTKLDGSAYDALRTLVARWAENRPDVRE